MRVELARQKALVHERRAADPLGGVLAGALAGVSGSATRNTLAFAGVGGVICLRGAVRFGAGIQA